MTNGFLIIDDVNYKLRCLYLKCYVLMVLNKEYNTNTKILKYKEINTPKSKGKGKGKGEKETENSIKEKYGRGKIELDRKQEEIKIDEDNKKEEKKTEEEKMKIVDLSDKNIVKIVKENNDTNTIIDIEVNCEVKEPVENDKENDKENDIEEAEYYNEQFGIGCDLMCEGIELMCSCVKYWCDKCCKSINDKCVEMSKEYKKKD